VVVQGWVRCAVQCSVQRAVQCLLCCLSQLGRIDSAPSVGMAWKRACALKWGVERGGVAITVGGEELAAVVIEEVWVQSRSLQLRSLSSRCTNCRRLDLGPGCAFTPLGLPCLQRNSDSQQSSPSFSATQSRVSSLPSPTNETHLGNLQPPNLSTSHQISPSTHHHLPIHLYHHHHVQLRRSSQFHPLHPSGQPAVTIRTRGDTACGWRGGSRWAGTAARDGGIRAI
jgi:hypothetical protein